MTKNYKIAFIGTGKMATAIALGLRKNGLPAQNIAGYDVSESAAKAFNQATDTSFFKTMESAISASDIVLLAVKPQFAAEAMADVKKHLGDKLLISITGGLTINSLISLSGSKRIVRVMPNTPALVGEGMSFYTGAPGVSKEDLDTAGEILRACGLARETRENMLDAVTGLSGCGPAYVMEFILALIDGGVYCGMSRETATESALQTVLGTAALCLKSGKPIAELRDAVISPGGITARGIRVLQKAGFKGTVADSVIAGTEYSIEMSHKTKQ